MTQEWVTKMSSRCIPNFYSPTPKISRHTVHVTDQTKMCFFLQPKRAKATPRSLLLHGDTPEKEVSNFITHTNTNTSTSGRSETSQTWCFYKARTNNTSLCFSSQIWETIFSNAQRFGGLYRVETQTETPRAIM